jgi:tRNA(Ile)-lysidine synthetase-like protein
MADLLPQVRRIIRRGDLLRDGAALVIGVSGGPDSLCLLHLLSRLAPAMGLRLHVAHLNHGLRGVEADADARFVADFAERMGLPYTIRQTDVGALANAAGLSLEEAARQARYRFLADVAVEVGADGVAVGHNADDQAETVLMHFLRGSGVAGLRGMLPKTPMDALRLPGEDAGHAGKQERVKLAAPVLIRPLLTTPRAAIAAYCAEQGLEPRFDRSNEDATFFRNRLRHELLPILEGYNPQIREVLAHTAETLAGDHEVLRAETERAWAKVVVSRNAGEVAFDLATWRALPLGLQRASLREAIHRLRASLRNINWEHVERAVWLAREGATGQRATLAAGLELEIDYRLLRIGPEAASLPSEPANAVIHALVGSGVTAAGRWRIVVERAHRSVAPEGLGADADPWIAYLDARALGEELVVRCRQPGDRFQPHGLGGRSVKLNEFMIDAKVPRRARADWPLLVCCRGIAWVCGLRLADWAIVGPDTEEVWVVRVAEAAEHGRA